MGVDLFARKKWTMEEAAQIPVSSLAYVGDAVYELYVRDALVSQRQPHSGKLYVASLNYVKASQQACFLSLMEEILTEPERDLCRRARNHTPQSHPRNADLGDYRQATALETLVGWLWLTGQEERLNQLMAFVLEKGEENAAIQGKG